jgi:hypothetical protein
VNGNGFKFSIDKTTGIINLTTESAEDGTVTVISGAPLLTFDGGTYGGSANRVSTDSDGGEAVIIAEMNFDAVKSVVFTYRVDNSGRVSVDHSFTMPTSADYNEIGITLKLVDGYDTLSWSLKPTVWSAYPDDHIARLTGTAVRDIGGDEVYREEPARLWKDDLEAFNISPNAKNEASNDFRATRYGVYTAQLTNAMGYGLALESDGSAFVRASVTDGVTSLTAGNYYKVYTSVDSTNEPNEALTGKNTGGKNYESSIILRIINNGD